MQAIIYTNNDLHKAASIVFQVNQLMFLAFLRLVLIPNRGQETGAVRNLGMFV